MKLIFEKSIEGRRGVMPPRAVGDFKLSGQFLRSNTAELPEVSELDLVRHYDALADKAKGVDSVFYPLGSCTMKYNPKLNEAMAVLSGFTDIHPLQCAESVFGANQLVDFVKKSLSEITGMDAACLQPAAGAHGEFAALLMIKAYHKKRGEKRDKIIVPDSAHGTNPASAAMAGYSVINIPSTTQGLVDLEALRAAVGEDTAALMLTNPNTLGLFEKDICAISDIVHEAGGLLYYDGANLNALMGIARPGDMGFDVMHVNLHKTFATPHGGGGPGSGPVLCKKMLAEFLPTSGSEHSIGRMKNFYGNFLVLVKAATYIAELGGEGLKNASELAVLNANYMAKRVSGFLTVEGGEQQYMHEFVASCAELKKQTGVTAADVCKALIDKGIHPPTMYFPLIVEEALMIEPTETESKQTIDEVIEALRQIVLLAHSDPAALKATPITTPVGRPDEVAAARKPVVRC